MNEMFVKCREDGTNFSGYESVMGWRFTKKPGGEVAIREVWSGHDELWSDGATIRLPGYAVTELVAFLQSQDQSEGGVDE